MKIFKNVDEIDLFFCEKKKEKVRKTEKMKIISKNC